MQVDTLRVGIGIITYNGPERVATVIQSLRDAQPHQDALRLIGKDIMRVGTIVVDDGSTHKNVQLLRKICEAFSVPLGEHRRNQGISAAWNHCITDLVNMGKADIVLLLNDDIKLTSGWLESIVYFMYHNPSAGLVGLHAPYDGELLVTDNGIKKGVDDDINFYVPHRGLCANGFCFGVWVADWLGAPKFDEEFMSFYEEVDLGVRLAQHEKLSYNIPWPLIEHEWGTTFYENQNLVASVRMTESRARFLSKWGGDVADLYKALVTAKKPEHLRWLFVDNNDCHVTEKSGYPIDVVR